MKGAGADLDVLMRSNAVDDASKRQDVPALSFGGRTQKNAPHIAQIVSGLIGKGIAVTLIEEDIAERGLADGDPIEDLPGSSRPLCLGCSTATTTSGPGRLRAIAIDPTPVGVGSIGYWMFGAAPPDESGGARRAANGRKSCQRRET